MSVAIDNSVIFAIFVVELPQKDPFKVLSLLGAFYYMPAFPIQT